MIAAINSVLLWENNEMPWRWDENHPFPANTDYKQRILNAMADIEKNTCIRFKNQNPEDNPG